MNFMSYHVVGVGKDSVEVWDGYTHIEPDRRARATMTMFVGESHDFRLGDEVDIVVVLRSRKDDSE